MWHSNYKSNHMKIKIHNFVETHTQKWTKVNYLWLSRPIFLAFNTFCDLQLCIIISLLACLLHDIYEMIILDIFTSSFKFFVTLIKKFLDVIKHNIRSYTLHFFLKLLVRLTLNTMPFACPGPWFVRTKSWKYKPISKLRFASQGM